MPTPTPTETRKLTYAEAALLDLLPTLALPDDARVLVAGRAANYSGWDLLDELRPRLPDVRFEIQGG